MKPAEHKISDASFTGHYFKILIAKLKKFKNAKHVVLISMVLLCILARYVVLSMDKSPIKNPVVTEKYPKTKPRIPKLMPNGTSLQQNNFFRFRQVRFNPVQKETHYFLVNEMQ